MVSATNLCIMQTQVAMKGFSVAVKASRINLKICKKMRMNYSIHEHSQLSAYSVKDNFGINHWIWYEGTATD